MARGTDEEAWCAHCGEWVEPLFALDGADVCPICDEVLTGE